MSDKAVQQYLERHAEPEAKQGAWTGPPAEHVVCIPACREDGSLIQTLKSLSEVAEADQALVVVVVNGGLLADEAVHCSNRLCWQELERAADLSPGPLAWGQLAGLRVLAVDRYSEGRRLPAKQGVGLARKIAGDIALRFVAEGRVRGGWMLCTDADVELPSNYLVRVREAKESNSALLYPFQHVPEGDVLQVEAMALYEAFLHYYVDGLRFAQSPYAFHTIGSLIGIRASAYAAVRGFPKREAGEDFYLLNKLAKVGWVEQLTGDPIRIRGRVSSRVPFGTGAAVSKIRGLLAEGQPYRVMAPQVFQGLKVWINALEEFSAGGDIETLRFRLEQSSSVLLSVVEQSGALRAAEAAAAQVQGAPLSRRLREWNDAFRTLKLLHALRDGGAGEMALGDAQALLRAMKGEGAA
ncbi:MAG: hypothetical protein VXW32_10300 [Myxococcota bacterium]|nr:hypothetical protein [Myxococcota bacterium]